MDGKEERKMAPGYDRWRGKTVEVGDEERRKPMRVRVMVKRKCILERQSNEKEPGMRKILVSGSCS